MTTVWTVVTALSLVALLAAWRPAPFRDLVTRCAAVFAGPAEELRARLTTLQTSLGRGLRELALHDGAELTGWRIAGHYLGGVFLTLVFVLGLLAEGALLAMVFGALYDIPVHLPEAMPSPETLSAGALVITPVLFGAVILDILGVTHLSNWGDRSLAVRQGAAVVCAVGLLLSFILLFLGGWYRGAAASEAQGLPAIDEQAMEFGGTPWPELDLLLLEAEVEEPQGDLSALRTPAAILTGGTALVLALALVFAGTGFQALVQLLIAIPTAAVWVGVAASIVVLGLWTRLVDLIYAALVSCVTWIASLVRRDPETNRWWVQDQVRPVAAPEPRQNPQPPAPETPTYSQPWTAGGRNPEAESRGNGAQDDDDPRWNPL